MVKSKINLIMDSGAPSIYNALSRQQTDKQKGVMGAHIKNRKYDDYSYVERPEFLAYRDKYISLVKEFEDDLDCHVNLDVINNQEKSYEMLKYLESQGLKPIPVFHFGCDTSWLKKYIDEGYEYIGIGGMVPNPNSILLPGLDNLWSDFLTDSKGYPIVKVHGFAISTPILATRYPWYSCDSTSWVKFGRYGTMIMPRKTKGKYDYTKSPRTITVSARSPTQKIMKRKHITAMSEEEQQEVKDYCESKGFKFGKSYKKVVDMPYSRQENEFWIKKTGLSADKGLVEVITEEGVSTNHFQRDMINAIFYLDMSDSVPEWPWPFKSKTKKGFGIEI